MTRDNMELIFIGYCLAVTTLAALFLFGVVR